MTRDELVTYALVAWFAVCATAGYQLASLLDHITRRRRIRRALDQTSKGAR